MSNLFEYSISLLVVLMAVSFMIANAQEDNNAAYNNTLKNSSNLSAMNRTVLNITNIEKIDHVKKIIIINSTNVADSAKSNSDNVSKVTPFTICGYTRPTRDAIYENQSLNAAVLSRIVEGTPHGYATYY